MTEQLIKFFNKVSLWCLALSLIPIVIYSIISIFFPILPYFISTSQISLSPFCISTYGTHPIFIIIETIFVLSILSMFTSIMLTLANHVNKSKIRGMENENNSKKGVRNR